MTRPTLADYCSTSAERHHSAERLFQMIASGAIRADAGRRLALRDAASAHRALASRATTGSTVLVPCAASGGRQRHQSHLGIDQAVIDHLSGDLTDHQKADGTNGSAVYRES